ncbi:MAG: CopG family transcriptional regulator [Actinomycetota bacterium]
MARLKTKSGTPLTKERNERLAKEAEKGYDLSKSKRARVQRGRPSLEEGVSPRISYRVGQGLYKQAKKKADAEGRTVSEIAREALERYVSRR